MKTQRPTIADDEHVVLKFRPRTSAQPPARPDDRHRSGDHSAAEDLSRYERLPDEPDDFRHRMLANIAAFAFTVALTAIGIWLAVSIADLRKSQDCVLMGRRDCAGISVTPQGQSVFEPSERRFASSQPAQGRPAWLAMEVRRRDQTIFCAFSASSFASS